MVHELGLTSRKNLMPHIKGLEDKGFISVREAGGRTFFLIYDPRVAIRKLSANGQLPNSDLTEINDLYVDLNQVPVEPDPVAPEPMR
jgi:hypothetical protein